MGAQLHMACPGKTGVMPPPIGLHGAAIFYVKLDNNSWATPRNPPSYLAHLKLDYIKG